MLDEELLDEELLDEEVLEEELLDEELDEDASPPPPPQADNTPSKTTGTREVSARIPLREASIFDAVFIFVPAYADRRSLLDIRCARLAGSWPSAWRQVAAGTTTAAIIS